MISFLEERAKSTNGKAVLCIRAYCPLDEERESAVRLPGSMPISAPSSSRKKAQRQRQINMFLIGIIFIMLWIFIGASIESVGAEVLSIIGSFAIWEAANIWIVDNPEIDLEIKRLKRVEQAEIIFQYISPEDVEKKADINPLSNPFFRRIYSQMHTKPGNGFFIPDDPALMNVRRQRDIIHIPVPCR